MSQKYTQIRMNLEAVQAVLDNRLRSDRQIAYMLDQLMEIATKVEFQRQHNVVEFPSSPKTRLFVLERPPQNPTR